jgi:hypothetical protein
LGGGLVDIAGPGRCDGQDLVTELAELQAGDRLEANPLLRGHRRLPAQHTAAVWGKRSGLLLREPLGLRQKHSCAPWTGPARAVAG